MAARPPRQAYTLAGCARNGSAHRRVGIVSEKPGREFSTESGSNRECRAAHRGLRATEQASHGALSQRVTACKTVRSSAPSFGSGSYEPAATYRSLGRTGDSAVGREPRSSSSGSSTRFRKPLESGTIIWPALLRIACAKVPSAGRIDA